MRPRKAATRKRMRKASLAAAPARRPRKKPSTRRALRAVGSLAAIGSAIAVEKIKQTIARGRRLTARHSLARTVGKAALVAGVTAAVTVTAEDLARQE